LNSIVKKAEYLATQLTQAYFASNQLLEA